MSHEHPLRPHPEQVVLEIGGVLGALVVYTDAGLVGHEIEISPAADDAERSHKEVLERPLQSRSTAYAAVFDRLPAGEYTLWTDDEARARHVAVTGGVITELDWS
jgi:hypothetical protein